MIPAAGDAADLMRSLSHPQRLLVLCALGAEEKSVAQLREELNVDQVPMSQQLMRLRVALQFVAIVVIMLVIWAKSSG